MTKPKSVIQLVFNTGLQIKAELKITVPEIRAIMHKDGDNDITLHTIAEGDVFSAPRSRGQEPEALYRLTDEEIHFCRHDVLFYSISEVAEPRKVIAAQVGIMKP